MHLLRRKIFEFLLVYWTGPGPGVIGDIGRDREKLLKFWPYRGRGRDLGKQFCRGPGLAGIAIFGRDRGRGRDPGRALYRSQGHRPIRAQY